MDTLLKNGDFFCDSRGIPVALYDEYEIIQRAIISLSVKKGSFLPDPFLGSEFYKLANLNTQNLDQSALNYAAEALMRIPEVEVSSVGCAYNAQNDAIIIKPLLKIKNKQYQLEVSIYGI